MDIEHLLQPVSPELPCGPDIDDYELEKTQYETFSQLKAKLEGEMKNGVLQPPKWQDIQESALALAASTKHLHLGVILTESGLMNEGLEGFRDGLRLIHCWSRDFWPQLYPREIRHTLIDSLASPRFLLKPKRVQIAKAAGGSFCFEDYEAALEEKDSADNDTANHAKLVLGVFEDTPREQQVRNLALIEASLNHARAIENTFDDLGGSEESVNLSNLRDLLSRMSSALRPLITEAAMVASADGATESGGGAVAPASGFIMGGRIGSREQAADQLEQIARFFEESEPSSPLPYLLRRARRCIGKNFMDLIDELATTKDHAQQVLSPIIGGEDSSIQ